MRIYIIHPEAQELLAYLAEHGLYLTNRSIRWRVIPRPDWEPDGKLDWSVEHPIAVLELVEYGLVEPHPGHEKVYRVSDTGHTLYKILQRPEKK